MAGMGLNILAPAADVTITTSVIAIKSRHGSQKTTAAETQITQTCHHQ